MGINNPGTGAAIHSGNYIGDNSANRAIPHSLGKTPQLVAIFEDYGVAAQSYFVHPPFGAIYAHTPGPAHTVRTVTVADITNFYVGNAGSYSESANATGINYYWVAIG